MNHSNGSQWVGITDVNGNNATIADGRLQVSIGDVQHNNTTNKQGGTTDEYYHLTAAQNSYIDQDVTNGSAPTFTADNFSDGGSNAIITTTQETNFETAYSHSQDNSQAHSDYLINNGDDSTSGKLTMAGADLGANALTVNSIEIVGADGEVNAAAIEDKFLRNDGADSTSGMLTCAEQSIVTGTNAQFKALPATTGIASVLIGVGRAGDGNSYIDFVSDTTYTSYGLRIIKGSGANAASQILHRGTGNLILQRQEGTGAIQCISSSGGVTLAAAATSWASLSDIRKKTDLEILTGGLDKLDKINPYYFRYKTDSEDMKRVGVIAQEIQEVCPEAVTIDEDGTLGVKYTELIPMLISAIKELKEKVV